MATVSQFLTTFGARSESTGLDKETLGEIAEENRGLRDSLRKLDELISFVMEQRKSGIAMH